MVRVFFLMFLVAFVVESSAQDLGVWTSVHTGVPINNMWRLSAGGEVRTSQGMGHVARWNISSGVNWSPTSKLGFSVGYLFIRQHVLPSVSPAGESVCDYWQTRNRFLVQASLKVRQASAFRVGLRLRYQFSRHCATTADAFDASGCFVRRIGVLASNEVFVRTRLDASVKTSSRFVPFVCYEVYVDPTDSFRLKKLRLDVGVECLLSNYSSVGIDYKRFSYRPDKAGRTHNILSVSYKCYFHR